MHHEGGLKCNLNTNATVSGANETVDSLEVMNCTIKVVISAITVGIVCKLKLKGPKERSMKRRLSLTRTLMSWEVAQFMKNTSSVDTTNS